MQGLQQRPTKRTATTQGARKASEWIITMAQRRGDGYIRAHATQEGVRRAGHANNKLRDKEVLSGISFTTERRAGRGKRGHSGYWTRQAAGVIALVRGRAGSQSSNVVQPQLASTTDSRSARGTERQPPHASSITLREEGSAKGTGSVRTQEGAAQQAGSGHGVRQLRHSTAALPPRARTGTNEYTGETSGSQAMTGASGKHQATN